MKAQPAPTVSGRYISGERPLLCTHAMPLTSGGTSSKGNWFTACGIARPEDKRETDQWPANNPPSRPFRKVRREPMSTPAFLTLKLYSPQLELPELNAVQPRPLAKHRACAHAARHIADTRKSCRLGRQHA